MFFFIATLSLGDCLDNVVLVHGNTGRTSDWDNTYDLLKEKGYRDKQIFIPDWGSKTCAACNDHNGSEEIPVRKAILEAIQKSCTGKIDVIAHSMGVTLSAQQIIKTGTRRKIDAFVGIAGAYRGVLSCGHYPFNYPNDSCGAYGFSIASPFLTWLYGKSIARRVYSIKSWSDVIICGTGTCLVYGVHSSHIKYERDSFTFDFSHYDLLTYTAEKQYDLIKRHHR